MSRSARSVERAAIAGDQGDAQQHVQQQL